MIDTHSHLLPGIDHGCPDLETSVLMAREAASSGITTVVCTPHLPDWDEQVVAQTRVVLDQVKAELIAAGIALELRLGFEVDLGIAAGVDTQRLSALIIEGSSGEGSQGALLLEMPYSGWPPFMQDTIFRLSTAGFVPVLAHPERNERVQRSPDLLEDCLKAGAVAQATAGSLGGFGRTAQRTFFRLISEGLISLVASDAHSFRKEGWTMGPMLAALDDRISHDDIRAFTETNPRGLLAGKRPLPVRPENGTASRRGRIWQRNGR